MNITNSLKKIVTGIGITAMTFNPLTIEIASEIRDMTSATLSKEKANIVLQEEKEKIGIDSNVELIILEKNELSKYSAKGFASLSENNGYIIGANKSDLTRILLRHELYHIKKGDCKEIVYKNDIIGSVKKIAADCYLSPSYWFINEPSASLYSITGISLRN